MIYIIRERHPFGGVVDAVYSKISVLNIKGHHLNIQHDMLISAIRGGFIIFEIVFLPTFRAG